MSNRSWTSWAAECAAALENIPPNSKLDWLKNKISEAPPEHREAAEAVLMTTILVAKDGGIQMPTKQAPWEKPVAVTSAIGFFIALIVLAIYFPRPTNFQFFVFRVILSIMTAAFAITIPGFLDLKLGTWLKAGGALAVFAVVYLINPAQLA